MPHFRPTRALIDGCPVDPPLTPRQRKALVLLIDNCKAGGPGLTNKDLGGARPAMSELRIYPHWKDILERPGVRGEQGKFGLTRIKAA